MSRTVRRSPDVAAPRSRGRRPAAPSRAERSGGCARRARPSTGRPPRAARSGGAIASSTAVSHAPASMAALARVRVGDTLGGDLELGAGLPRELLGARLVLRLDACAPRRERARSPVRRAGGPRRCRPARDDAERACASSRRRSASAPSASSMSLRRQLVSHRRLRLCAYMAALSHSRGRAGLPGGLTLRTPPSRGGADGSGSGGWAANTPSGRACWPRAGIGAGLGAEPRGSGCGRAPRGSPGHRCRPRATSRMWWACRRRGARPRFRRGPPAGSAGGRARGRARAPCGRRGCGDQSRGSVARTAAGRRGRARRSREPGRRAGAERARSTGGLASLSTLRAGAVGHALRAWVARAPMAQ